MQNKRAIIFCLCAAAALHVFIFSAAFPFFSVVDEQMHLDLIVRYSHADLPRTLMPPAAEALPFLAIFGTPEFLWQSGGNIPPPPWKQPIETVREKLLAKEAAYQEKFQNHEAASPPFYYSMAGAWWRLGKILGLDGARLLYWMRFLNVPFVVALTWLGGFAARKIFSDNKFICVTVPAFIAFLPQTVFYSINNDIVAPLAFGAAFVLLLKFWDVEKLSARLGAATGLALAATFLAKISNLPLLAVVGIFLGLKIVRLAQNKNLRPSVPALMILFLGALLPMAAWMAWCKINFGDLTGSILKVQFLNWQPQPFVEWFHHPLFTAQGFWFFVKGNLATFWQGEMLWHRLPMASPAMNLFYAGLSIALLLLAFFVLIRRPQMFTAPQKFAMWFGFACVAAMFVFFALLSVKYDFQDCFYPSREHPFFVSGRLMLGMLVPFLILLAAGLDHALRKFSLPAKFILLGALLCFVLASEIAVDWKIFSNEYNWFHL